MHIIIFFLLLFSFRVPIFYNSTILAIILLFLYFVVNNKYMSQMFLTIRNRYVITYFSLIVVCFTISLVFIVWNSTYDLSILRSFITQAFNLVGIVFFIALLRAKGVVNVNAVIKIILQAYCIQSCIQLFALASPEFYEIIKNFQVKETAQLLQDGYGGIRGLALSSELTFALSSSYGAIFIVHSFYIIRKRKLDLFDYFLILINFLGANFTGRTAFIGVFIMFFLLLIFLPIQEKIKFTVVLSFFLVVFISLIFIIFDKVVIERVIEFSFELFLNLFNGEGLQTDSTNRLKEMLSLDINEYTWIFGDGRYIGSDGKYYGHVDVGYFRQALFGGVFYILVLFFAQLVICFYPILNNPNKYLFNDVDRDRLYFIFYSSTLFAYLILLNFKGESLFYLKQIQMIVFLVAFFFMITERKKLDDND